MWPEHIQRQIKVVLENADMMIHVRIPVVSDAWIWWNMHGRHMPEGEGRFDPDYLKNGIIPEDYIP
jgi:hypothetical protein